MKRREQTEKNEHVTLDNFAHFSRQDLDCDGFKPIVIVVGRGWD